MSTSEHEHTKTQELPFLNDRYRDVALLGAGGMGKLYKAFDSVLMKPVAVKVLSSKLPDTKMVLRFQQEAKLASRLQHTNIVKVLDFGAGSQNELYLIMDLVEGQSLEQYIESVGPLSLEAAIPLITQMCDGLMHAHNKGVIHRDIKPSNIMLTQDKQNGLSVRIVDFGLARLESRDVRITQTGDTIGTPLYISPEQIRGEDIDFRADIYSLGCVIFTILSGNPPYRGKKALDTFQKHLHDPIPSLADRGVEHPAIEEIDSILVRMLAKSPDDRYQSLSELKEDLMLLSPEPETAVKKLEDANFDLKIPFLSSTALPVPRWVVFSLLSLMVCVPLLMMAFATQPQPKIDEPKLSGTESSHIFAPRKVRNVADLFYNKDTNWHSMDCRVVDEDLEYLSTKRITSLDLPQTRVKGWGFKFLKNQPLNTLNLIEAKIEDKNLRYLNDLKQLENLKICYTWISNAGLKTMTTNPKISYISLEGCRKLDDSSILEVLRIAPNLHSINLTFTPITKKGLEYLKRAKNLDCLTVGLNDLTDDDFQPVQDMQQLTLIDISKCKNVTDLTIKRMMKRKQLRELLVVNCPKISAGTLDAIQKANPKLRVKREGKRYQDEEVKNAAKIFCGDDTSKLPDLEF